ncbi:DNA helicase-2 / ATP-dependent DNA helicase PcrA [Parelusimicrobium proximum]|uniref:ATP-dependent helicase n=1 Tax=Parelusimicrobium proximum TaxID=3228953 RepID=UPI003D170B26
MLKYIYMSLTDHVNSLNKAQKEAVQYNTGPCLIIAGAGTGKTRTLTTKIAVLIEEGVNPSRILAVTFTNKAAAEMRHRIESLAPGAGGRVWVNTFHSLGVRLLRQHAPYLKLTKDFVIYDEDEQKKIISMILAEMGQKDTRKEAGQMVSLISRAKDDMVTPDEFSMRANASGGEFLIRTADVYKKYQAKLAAAGALDFGDLLVKTYELLTNFEDVREYYQNFFQYVLVDEYQDTNHTQYLITKILSVKHKKLCVVGDPDQSIYSWRGANIRNILEFERDFPDAKVIVLEENYRSTQNILACANTLIDKNKKRKKKNLFSCKGVGLPVEVREMVTEGEEARYIASTIAHLVEEGVGLNDIAVFYRTNAQSRNFEDTFRRYQLPYRLIGAVRFYDRKEIKDILAYGRVLVNPADTVSLLRIINTPKRNIGDTAQDKIISYASQNGIAIYHALKHQAYIEGLTPTARRSINEFMNLMETLRLEITHSMPSLIVEKILNLTGYLKILEDGVEKDPENVSRVANLNELVNAVKEYEERKQREETTPTLSDFLQEIALITGADESEGAESGAVTLMTVHLAKGLEFPYVFVSGLEEGLFPLSSKDEDELEEERRLCYVAMTRAKDQLYMTSAATRRIFGKMFTNLPSRFLFESGLVEEQPAPVVQQPKYTEYKSKYGMYGQKNKSEYSTSYTKKRYDAHGYEEEDNALAYDDAPSREKTEQHLAAASTAPKVGRRVKHGVFGEGKIISVSGSGEAMKISVVFANGVKRTFLHKYAPLELI